MYISHVRIYVSLSVSFMYVRIFLPNIPSTHMYCVSLLACSNVSDGHPGEWDIWYQLQHAGSRGHCDSGNLHCPPLSLRPQVRGCGLGNVCVEGVCMNGTVLCVVCVRMYVQVVQYCV